MSLPELNILSNSAADKLTTSILFLRLLNCLMTSSVLKGGLRMSLFSVMSSDRFSFVGLLLFFSCKLLLAEPSDHRSTLLTVCLRVMAMG